MAILTKEQILDRNDIKRETIPIPEWGGEIIIQGMTGVDRDAFEQSIINSDQTRNLTNLRAKLLARSIVDESGNRIFNDDDIIALGKKSAKALDKAFDVAKRLSGIGNSDVEELQKN